MDNFVNSVKVFFENNLVEAGMTILFAIIVSFLAHRLIDVLFHYQRQIGRYKRSIELQKRSRTIGRMVKTGLDIVIWIYAILAFLQHLGIDVSKLMTGAGILGALIGFGAQNTVRDILAGIFIVLENQYRVGDLIEIQLASRVMSGTVENISLRITQIRDDDGKVHTIRNGASESVTNMSFEYANVNFTVGVAYDTDIDKLEKVINEIGLSMKAEDSPFRKEIIEPIEFLRINRFLDSEIEIKCRGKVRAGSQWNMTGEFRRLLKKAFDENGIEFPFPQVVVHDPKDVPNRLAKNAAAAKVALDKKKTVEQ